MQSCNQEFEACCEVLVRIVLRKNKPKKRGMKDQGIQKIANKF